LDSFDSATKKFRIPLLNDSVSAGFPSPADDYTEENIDLNDHLISNPFSTFFLRVKGDSMINAGIKDKDLIIVDKSLTARPGNIIIAMIDGEFTIKRLSIKNNKLYLKAENNNYPDFSFENHIDSNDPTNNCLDVAIITAPEKRTKKTIKKLKTVAGRVLLKK